MENFMMHKTYKVCIHGKAYNNILIVFKKNWLTIFANSENNDFSVANIKINLKIQTEKNLKKYAKIKILAAF